MSLPKSLQQPPIKGLPDATLSECLFLTGKRGYGKSYSQRAAMERALTLGLRCGWIDAMGIAWGITVDAHGGPGFPNVVVFGGEHAHLPISETSGAALGATLAKASFSWVLDLSGLKSKAARVRFLADFGEALYEANKDQLLLFIDEVDLWAPQSLFDKQGPAAKLLGVMHELVRRGRIKGLSAWLATQRPAEVSKGVISQADAMVTLKLTLPHDIEAVMLWMKKHLGKERAAEMEQKLPGLKKGEALVYLTEPEVSVSVVQFPLIKTLDNMKPRQPGEAELKGRQATVDLAAIREQLGAVEEELRANDPETLRARIEELEAERGQAVERLSDSVITADRLDHELDWARASGRGIGYEEGAAAERNRLEPVILGMRSDHKRTADLLREALVWAENAAQREAPAPAPVIEPVKDSAYTFGASSVSSPIERLRQLGQNSDMRARLDQAAKAPQVREVYGEPLELQPRQKKLLDAIAWWNTAGIKQPTRVQVAVVAGYSPTSSTWDNLVSSVKTAGFIDYPSGSVLALTELGQRSCVSPAARPTKAALREMVKAKLRPAQWLLLEPLLGAGKMSREELLGKVGRSSASSTSDNLISSLSSLELVAYPEKGFVEAAKWL